jgi:hypothetical protein
MNIQEYEELYCTYCDSQRCGEGKPSETCPYWEIRQQMNSTPEAEVDTLIKNITDILSDYSRKWRCLGTDLLKARAEITDMAIKIINVEYNKYKAARINGCNYHIADELDGKEI